MRRLVPDFILENTKDGNLSGCFMAIAVNIDLIGFTELTQSFMQRSHAGAETLTDTINVIFTPAIHALESRGGFISGFAGDAFTALFDSDQLSRALAAAVEIRDIAIAQAWQKTDFGDLKLSVRIGIGSGEVAWEIVPNPAQTVYWFSGIGIAKAVNAQQKAAPNELLCGLEELKLLDSDFCGYEHADDSHCRILFLNQEIPMEQTETEELDQSSFVPETLSQMQADGEFRDVLSCFVNLQASEPEHRNQLIDSALAHGGFISHIDCTDKGWVMFVMFGVPKCYDRSQLRAVTYALEQQAKGGNKLRIGLSEGRAYAGFVGSATRGEYTGMGSAINLAARMMLKAAWGEVWLDKAIYKAVGNGFICDRLGLINYKGYPQALETFRLSGKQRNADYGSFANRFLGREAELDFLQQSCHELFSGKFAGISYLYGAAGQGKSRLLFELKQRLGNEVRIIYLQSDSIHRIALSPFATWIRSTFTKGLSGTEAARIAEFRKNWATLEESFANQLERDELKRIESIIAALIGLEWEGSIYSQLDAKSKAGVSGFAIKSLIELLCRQKPLVMVMEDLHWLDRESEKVLVLLSRKVSETALKIIITSRFKDDGSKPEIRFDKNVKVDLLVLDGLGSASVKALLQDVLAKPVDEDLVSYVQDRSLGNPFIAVQLSIYLLETGRLETSDTGFTLKEACIDLPTGVQEILVARIDRLETELKRLVHTASVLGCEFSEAILKAMLNAPECKPCPLGSEVVKSKLQLGELEQIWNAVSELSYIFSHSLLRDAAYGMQLMKQLKHLHLLAAEAMKSCYAEDKARYWQIAYHYEKAGDSFSAAQYHQKAGDFDKNSFLFSEALEHYVTAKNLIQTMQGDRHPDYALCLSRIGMLHFARSEYDQSLPYFEQALSIQEETFGKDTSQCLDNIQCIGSNNFVKGNYDKALSCFNKALKIQREISGEVHQNNATYLNSLGNIFRECNDFGKSLDYYNQALIIRQQLWGENHAKIATTYNDMADMFWRKGDYKQALAYYEKALAVQLKVLGDEHPENAISLNGIGDVYSQLGMLDKALNSYQKALAIRINKLGNRHAHTADTLNNLGILYDITGEFDKAIQHFEQALQIKQEVFGDLHMDVGSVLVNLGGAYDHQGKYDLALEQHEKALLILKEVLGEKYPETASCLIGIGAVHENKGDYDKALGYYEQALEVYLEVMGEKYFETSIALANIGGIYEFKKDFQAALSFYQRALAIRKEILGADHPATQRTSNKIIGLQEMISANP